MSEIPSSTCWTDLAAANDLDAAGPVRQAALGRLVRRYEGLARGFLAWRLKQAGVRGDDAVDECFQRFAEKLCEGRFDKVSRERKRFSPYLKTVLANLVVDYLRKSGGPGGDVGGVPADDGSEEINRLFRELLLGRALGRMKEADPTFYPVMRLRLDNPAWTADQMAAAISTPEVTRNANWVKQQLHRGRERLKEYLRLEVAYEIGSHLSGDIDEELALIGLGEASAKG